MPNCRIPALYTQFSSLNPATRSNSRVLFVTSVQSSARAWLASHKSFRANGRSRRPQPRELRAVVFANGAVDAIAHLTGSLHHTGALAVSSARWSANLAARKSRNTLTLDDR